jgi:hypothetical protein
MDIVVEPLDATNGVFHRMNVVAKAGTDKPHVRLSYAYAPNTVNDFHRTESMDEFANDVYLMGLNKDITAATDDSASQADFGVHEYSEVFSEIAKQAQIDTLAAAELGVRKQPLEFVSVAPTPENSASVFTDYDLGDFVTTQASDVTGEAIQGLQRIYGYTLEIMNEGYERVSELVVSKDAS